MKTFSQADRTVIAAMMHMRGPEMKPLLQFFENLLEESKEALIRADGDTVRRLQGRAGVLKEFVDAVANAPQAMEKMR